MAGQAGATPCLLTAEPNEVDRFAAVPGMLKLVVQQVKGQTDLDCVNSKVSEISDLDNPIAVTHTCDRSSLGFQVESGKKYFVALAFSQLIDPFTSVANLNEACGQHLDTIKVTNLFPGYIIEVA